MLIRSTPRACLVILRNGLTLELCYDQNMPREQLAAAPGDDDDPQLYARAPVASQGVWIFREEVLFEVKVGQA